MLSNNFIFFLAEQSAPSCKYKCFLRFKFFDKFMLCNNFIFFLAVAEQSAPSGKYKLSFFKSFDILTNLCLVITLFSFLAAVVKPLALSGKYKFSLKGLIF